MEKVKAVPSKKMRNLAAKWHHRCTTFTANRIQDRSTAKRILAINNECYRAVTKYVEEHFEIRNGKMKRCL